MVKTFTAKVSDYTLEVEVDTAKLVKSAVALGQLVILSQTGTAGLVRNRKKIAKLIDQLNGK